LNKKINELKNNRKVFIGMMSGTNNSVLKAELQSKVEKSSTGMRMAGEQLYRVNF
jgi:hypothetical protein